LKVQKQMMNTAKKRKIKKAEDQWKKRYKRQDRQSKKHWALKIDVILLRKRYR
jgi:hypothetical protein